MGREWDGDCVEDDYEDFCEEDSYDTNENEDEDEQQSCGCANGCYDCLGMSRRDFY